jgi:hypothetical protein
MKRKTIERIIVKKLNAWLDTIDDVTLRDDVRENLVLSGGSITSMFLQEDVNDFDIYIQNINVCERLAQYYCKADGIEVLNGNLKDIYLEQLPEDELYVDTEWGQNMSAEAIIIKSLHYGQIKLNITGAGIQSSAVTKEIELKEYHPVFFSQNAISLSNDIQIVIRFTGTVEEIHRSYDFVHATNYYTFKEGLVTNTKALECILTKELKYQGSLYPLTSVIRMKKFIARKWTMNAGEVLKMLYQVSELDLKDPVVLEEQLVGVDIAYFSLLIDAIRNVDPKKLDSSYINKLIDKIFNEFDGDNI